MSIMSRGNIPAMVTVNGVIMNVTEKSLSCLAGIRIKRSSDSEPITYSDQSGKFSITEVVEDRAKGFTIVFDDESKQYAFEPISIANIVQGANEVHINVIVEPV